MIFVFISIHCVAFHHRVSIMIDTLIKFECPATCIIAGASESGKSTFLFKMFKNAQFMFSKVPKKIIYCYSTYQPLFDDMKTVENIEFF